MSENTKVTVKRQRQIAIILCIILSPCIFFWLYTRSWLIEVMRPDDYSYGMPFYVVITLISLLCNALIVRFIYTSSSIDEKFRLWLKGTLMALLASLAVILLVVIITLFAFSGRWNFG